MIVVAGEALVDLIPTPAGDLSVNPGGGPFNTARWLGRLGAEVGFLGSFAADPLGQRLREELVAAGVSLDQVVDSELPTTLALAQLDRGGAARYSFYMRSTSSAELAPEQAVAVLPDELDALYVGSLGLVLEPIASAVEAAVGAGRARGALVMVDPNVRPSLIEDRSAYLERLERVLAAADVIKLSVEDAAWLWPGEPPQAAARRLLSEHAPQLVLLTAGPDGATVLTPAGETLVAAVDVEVVDTIGAGDASSAGFLAEWLQLTNERSKLTALPRGRGFVGVGNKTPPSRELHAAAVEAAAVAARVAAAACSVRGATPPADLGPLLQRGG